MNTDTALPVGAALVFIPIMWCLVLFLIAALGGWRSLAQYYPHDPSQTGPLLREHRFCQMSTSFLGSYNNCMNIDIYENGAYLRPWALFTLFHPPVFIRWTDIHSLQVTKILGLFPVINARGNGFNLKFYRASGKDIANCVEHYKNNVFK